MLKKYLFFLATFIFCANHAWGATLYFNGATNSNWNTLTNWWTDSWFTLQASSLPTVSDDVILSATVSSNSGAAASVNTLTFNDGSNGYRLQIPVTVANGAIFNGASNNFTSGSIIGNATFNDSSKNQFGTVTGNATFNGTSFKIGTITGNATFNDASYDAGGTITGNATFNGTSHMSGNVNGNATFNTTYYDATAPSGGTFTISVGGNWWIGEVLGTAYGSDSQAITTYVFNGSSENNGRIHGNATFNGSSVNRFYISGNATFNGSSRSASGSTIGGSATFNNSSWNSATITGNATFNDTGYNGAGTITSNATFNDSSHNDNIVNGNATFNDSSYNVGTINGNADVYSPSPNPIGGTVLGTVTYYDYVAPIISQTTAVSTPTSDTTPNYTFTTDEAGTITYGGSCSSATTSATVGANTITFSALAGGTYSNCTVTVTDAATNASNVLSVSTFTINTSIQSWTSSPTAWVGTPSTTTLETAPTQPVIETPIQTPAPTENNPVADVPATPTTDIGSSIAIPVNNTFGTPSEQPTSVLSLNINLSPRRNSPEDVMRLQEFLNLYEGETLVVTGIYDWGTQEAVKRFQVKYAPEILAPLGLTEPTGNVGIFTRTKINSMIARDSLEPAPFNINITPQRNNNPTDVVRLQDFLNTYEDEFLRLTGVYDIATQEAVKRFQVKYASDILKPLGLRNPTSNVGIFMRAKINSMIKTGE